MSVHKYIKIYSKSRSNYLFTSISIDIQLYNKLIILPIPTYIILY